MYEINSENLKWAFKKLKRYIYYYNGSNYLKKRIIDFQKEYRHDTFEKMADYLVNLSTKDKDILSDSGISFLAYPKKDTTNLNYDKQKIEINQLNLFIDMPIMYYLVDILFCLEIYNRFPFHDNKYSFGNNYDNRFQYIDPLKNNLLFGNHTINYSKWKNLIYKTLSENTTQNNLLIKLDFKHCFYNVSINIIAFLSKYFNAEELEKPIVKIMINIYRLYTKTIVLKNMSVSNSFENNYVNLPIGLLSSYPILNILLTDLDKKIANNIKCIGYSRYVDDILIVVKQEKQKLKFKDKKEIISNVFPDIFAIEDDKLYTVNEVLVCKKLEVNNKKIDCVPYRKGTNFNVFKKKINSILKPSLDFDDEIDDESSTEIDFSLGLEYLRSRTNKYLGSFRDDEIEEGIAFFESLKRDDLINLYSYWKDILNFIKIHNQDNEALKYYKNKILDAINNIEITSFSAIKSERLEYVCEVLKNTLKNELSISEYYVEKHMSNEQFIFRLNYNQIINYISLCVEEKLDTYSWLIYPTEVLFEEISFYLSVHHQEWIDDIYDKCHALFKEINGYEKFRDNYLNIHNYDNLIKIFPSDSIIGKRHRHSPKYDTNGKLIEEKIAIAVANMSMNPKEIENTDIDTEFPNSYKYNELVKMIKSARNKGVEMFIFPEFCLPYTYTFEMIRLCSQYRISLICGLTHYYIKDSVVVNVTLIYDNQLKLSLGKIKNYIAPEEKIILANRNLWYEESLYNYYFILDNGTYQYSTMTCYEVTNIKDRAMLTDEIEVLYMPVFNRDTKYFSNVIESFARDASCFIVQSNTNFYGDSRITGPYNEVYMDVVKLKGGENNYYVLANISLHELSIKHTNDELLNEDIDLLRDKMITFKEFESKESKNKNYPNKHKRIKSLVAGNHQKRKYNGIR